jgi:predicted aspartyl protease
MPTQGVNGVGRFNVDLDIANSEDLVRAKDGTLPQHKVRRLTISGVVDPGAAMLVLPKAVVEQLGLPLGGKIKVRYADGRRAQRREAKAVYVEVLGRNSIFDAVVEPKRQTALIGAIVLEALDLLVDSRRARLIPRDPHGPIYEIE